VAVGLVRSYPCGIGRARPERLRRRGCVLRPVRVPHHRICCSASSHAPRTISLSTFYARRDTTLLPGLGHSCCSTSSVVSTAFSCRRSLRDLTADAVAAALYVVNIRFARPRTPITARRDVEHRRPLLHYWSLAVEGAVLLRVAALVLGVARSVRAVRAGSLMGSVGGRVGIAVGVVAVASFVTSLVLTRVAVAGGRSSACRHARGSWGSVGGTAVSRRAWRSPPTRGGRGAPSSPACALIVIAGVALRRHDGVPGRGSPCCRRPGCRARDRRWHRAVSRRSHRGCWRSGRCASSGASRTRCTCGTGASSCLRRRSPGRHSSCGIASR
jgi:hypothetical protein